MAISLAGSTTAMNPPRNYHDFVVPDAKIDSKASKDVTRDFVRAIRMHVAFECAHEPMYRSSLPPPDPYLESTVDSASQFGCFKPATDLAFGKGSVDIADPMRRGQPDQVDSLVRFCCLSHRWVNVIAVLAVHSRCYPCMFLERLYERRHGLEARDRSNRA